MRIKSWSFGRRIQTGLLITALAVSFTYSARASDHTNTDEHLPLEVEDAYPIEFRAAEFQLAVRYENLDEQSDRFVFIPELKYGAFRNTHIWIQGNFLTDKDGDENTGEFGLLYNFNTETLSSPAFSLSVRLESSFEGTPDTTVRGIITKSAGRNRFNLNLDYTDVGERDPGERSSRYLVGLAWDRSIRNDMVLLADVFTERSKQEGEENETVAELGMRYQLDPDTVLAGGVGFGLSGGAGSRDFTATIGYQRSF